MIKVLYIASNPLHHATLMLEREITVMSESHVRRYDGKVPVTFTFMPELPVERVEDLLFDVKPDVLHISAHGDQERLTLTNHVREPVTITSHYFRAAFAAHKPSVVFLSACNSREIAEDISKLGVAAIGTSAPITNIAARSGADRFYRALAQGRSVRNAHESAKAIVHVLTKDTVSVEFFASDPALAERVLGDLPQIVAAFEDEEIELNKRGVGRFHVGLRHPPQSTHQIVLCTDDDWFFDHDEGELNIDNLCSVLRGSVTGDTRWDDDVWEVDGDFRIIATAIEADGQTTSVTSTLCTALETYYCHRLKKPIDQLPQKLRRIIARLRDNV